MGQWGMIGALLGTFRISGGLMRLDGVQWG